jgi:hypothetical protein
MLSSFLLSVEYVFCADWINTKERTAAAPNAAAVRFSAAKFKDLRSKDPWRGVLPKAQASLLA